MVRKTCFAALAVMIAGPAFAAGGCSTSSSSKFQPKATLESQLKAEGLTVRQIKTEKGCYEVYAVDKAGKKVNAAHRQTVFLITNWNHLDALSSLSS